MTKAEKIENEFIVKLGCVVCHNPSVEIHHNRRYGGKRKHAPKLPLCHAHHSAQSNEGYHHAPATFEALHGNLSVVAELVERKLIAAGISPSWRKRK